MEITFQKPGAAASVAVEPITQPAPAAPTPTPASTPTTPLAAPTDPTPAASQVPATVRAPGALAPQGLVLGDKLPDFSDIILPRINIAQNIGELKDSYTPGTVVFGTDTGRTVLYMPPDIDTNTGNVKRVATLPAHICVLGFRPTRFVEKVVGGIRGQICNTEAEVRAAGGTLDYTEQKLKAASGMKLFQPLAEAVVTIEKPEAAADDDTVFVYAIEGKKYALGLWSMKGTAYTSAAKRVFFTARSLGCLRGGYPTWHFDLTTRLEKYPGGNQAWIPICVAKTKSSPEWLAFVAQILNPTQEA